MKKAKHYFDWIVCIFDRAANVWREFTYKHRASFNRKLRQLRQAFFAGIIGQIVTSRPQ